MLPAMNHSARIGVLGAVTVAAGIGAAFLPRIAQPADYHNFADQRTFLGVPNFLNVVSNAPFLLVGAWGLWVVLGRRKSGVAHFLTRAERWPYLILSVGLVATCSGSAHYHWSPDNLSLVGDRLPMTLGFMALLSAMIMERVNLRVGLGLLGPLLALGLASVLLWYRGELRGAGDLRLYLMVQFFTLILILLILWLFPARYTHGADLLVAMGFYVLAKIFEALDRPIYNLGHIVSGHTLKHLAAALGVYWVLRMVARRQPVAAPADCQDAKAHAPWPRTSPGDTQTPPYH
jgi:hypothetical protein